MSFRDRRDWMRQNAKALSLGVVALFSGGNAHLAQHDAAKAAKHLHDTELRAPNQSNQCPAADQADRPDTFTSQGHTFVMQHPAEHEKKQDLAERVKQDPAERVKQDSVERVKRKAEDAKRLGEDHDRAQEAIERELQKRPRRRRR
jgi:hypothetical protein